jgi:hypothetical protein
MGNIVALPKRVILTFLWFKYDRAALIVGAQRILDKHRASNSRSIRSDF